MLICGRCKMRETGRRHWPCFPARLAQNQQVWAGFHSRVLCEIFPPLQELLKMLFGADAFHFSSTIRWAFLRETAGRFHPHCQLKHWNHIQCSLRNSARSHPSVEDRRGEQSRTVSQERGFSVSSNHRYHFCQLQLAEKPCPSTLESENFSGLRCQHLIPLYVFVGSCCFNWHHSETDQKHCSDTYVDWDVKHMKHSMIRLSYVWFTVNESRIMSWLSGGECLLF